MWLNNWVGQVSYRNNRYKLILLIYNGIINFLITIGMWGGLVPRIVMIGTLTAAQWFIYDAVKVYLRMPRPPPPEMPESLKKKMGLA